ncbi:TPA: DUF4236 domain-containing protein [Mannheimia haemolytica]|nr:DUF4236 domain-containing protein [Mannheimia haemolytica]HDL5625460.1 DUF4236 domain-containing protein [Mannheimia haemolytica]HDL5843777.1 DUF4236 domain-containing protein [Mannheimia haemolytica]HDL5852870.1 DUF4236 domain-containing protein [Mannheimia haemolytica]HDZ3664165.1 DUF4236 domain-containing protein [Mannheimia haemolytica]
MARKSKNLFSFRKRIKVLPGITLNLSRSGISTTLGARGASVNVGDKGVFLNTGIPGTGIYNRQKILSLSKDNSDEINSALGIDYNIASFFLNNSKSRTKASWIAFFTGFIGGHKFYLGQPFQGLFYLFMLPTGLSFLLWILDIFLLGFMGDERFFIKYNARFLSQVGIDYQLIDRKSNEWHFFVGNGKEYIDNGGGCSTLVKVIILIIVAVFCFYMVVGR